MSGDTGDTINNNANIELTVSANSGDLTGDTNITGSLGTNDTLMILNAADATTTFDTNNDVFETITIISLHIISYTLQLAAYIFISIRNWCLNN